VKSLILNNRTVEERGITYLQQINLKIYEGDHWVFLGANGSGKSRLGELIGREWPGKCG